MTKNEEIPENSLENNEKYEGNLSFERFSNTSNHSFFLKKTSSQKRNYSFHFESKTNHSLSCNERLKNIRRNNAKVANLFTTHWNWLDSIKTQVFVFFLK